MSKNKKLIHIHAKCNAFEVYEVVPENKAVQRLVRIRNNFKFTQGHYEKAPQDHLTVKTGVVNPEFNFH